MKTTDIISENIYGPLSDSARIYVRNVLDRISAAGDKYVDGFTFFAGRSKQELALLALSSASYGNYLFYGGYENAERRILGVFAPDEEPETERFPIKALTFRFDRKDKKLTHRDFLGAFMSQGIARDTIGDILVGDGTAVAFLTDTAAKAVSGGVFSVGGADVGVTEGFDENDLPETEYAAIEGAVSSLRIDCVTALAARCSRSHAVKLVRSGGVHYKGRSAPDVSDRLTEGDEFFIKGCGRFVLSSINGSTKKGKLTISLKKFI